LVKNNPTKIVAKPGGREIVVTRIFDAPRQLVFRTITDPNLIPRWWGPSSLVTTVDKMDLRSGGRWRFVQRAPDGKVFAFNGIYKLVDPPESLVYTFEFEGMPGHVALETINFEESDGRTTMTDTVLFATVEDRDDMVKSGMESGTIESSLRLTELLEETKEENRNSSTDREIKFDRVFDAPRDLVFEAWTNPEQLVKWWGPKGFTITTQKIDVKAGGSWNFIMHGPNGIDYPNTIVYDEIVRPERLVYSHGGGSKGDGSNFQSTVTFVKQDKKTTRVTMRLLFTTISERYRAVKEYRAIEGGNQTLERLGEQLKMVNNSNDANMVVKSGYAPVNGLRLYYEIHGTGEPLVLLHGGVGAVEMFIPILSTLAANRQIIGVDLQAHGRTADIDRPLSYQLMGDDIAALIKYLGFENVDIMGYSLGGGVALQTTIRHPEIVRKLIVVSAAFKRDGWFPEIQAGMAQGSEAAEPMKHTPMYQLYSSIAPRPEDWPVLFTKLGDLLRQDYDWSKDVTKIKSPTLIAIGDSDSIRPSHAVDFFELLGGGQRDGGWDGSGKSRSQLAIIPGTTHYEIFMSAKLATIVTSFLGAPMPREKSE
jgi:uncharacterized protein YndB with AHSA1/START domain/pimeloyl-ACP methyl ester carboxylesterase